MQTVKMREGFGGIMPRRTAKQLPPNMAQTALNCVLVTNRLEPIKAQGSNESYAGSSTKDVLYKWRRGGSADTLYSFDSKKASCATSSVFDDDKHRFYYVDGVKPKVYGYVGASTVIRNMEQDTPATPTAAAAYIMTPLSGFTCDFFYFAYKDGVSLVSSAATPATLDSYDYTDDGIKLTFKIPVFLVTTTVSGSVYQVRGYRYRLKVPAFNGQAAFNLPSGTGALTVDSPTYSNATQDLLDTDGNSYGKFEIVNVTDTPINETIDSTKASAIYAGGSSVTFFCSLNYKYGSVPKYYSYLQTAVDDWDVESPPSGPTAVMEVKPGQRVTVSGLGWTGANQNRNRLYRTAAGTEETKWLYLDETTAATYVDKKSDSELAEELPLFENPPDDIEGIVYMPGGFYAAFRGHEILFTPPFYPHSWPTEYRLTVDYDVLGLAVSGNDLIVLTTGFPYLISGTHPDSMSQTKLPYMQALASKLVSGVVYTARRAICSLGNTVFFPSPDGMCAVQGGTVTVMTEKFYTKAQWEALAPWRMVAGVYDNRLYVWSYVDGAYADGLIFSFGEDPNIMITTTDIHASACLTDPEDDALYIVKQTGNTINKWEGGATNKTMVWKSKEFQFNEPLNFNALRVIADSYPANPDAIEVRIYAAGALAQTLEVEAGVAFRIPDLFPEKVWSFEIESAVAIDSLELSTSMKGLRDDSQ